MNFSVFIGLRNEGFYETWKKSFVKLFFSLVGLAYIRLNIQTPCPPRGAVPVNQGCCRRLFHSQHPDRLRSWMRLPGSVNQRMSSWQKSGNGNQKFAITLTLSFSIETPRPAPRHQKCPCGHLHFSTACVSAACERPVLLEGAPKYYIGAGIALSSNFCPAQPFSAHPEFSSSICPGFC